VCLTSMGGILYNSALHVWAVAQLRVLSWWWSVVVPQLVCIEAYVCRVRRRLLAMLGGGSCALAGGIVACVLDCCRSDGSSWAAAGGTTRGCGRPHVRCVHVGAGDWWMYVVCQAGVGHAAGVHTCRAGAFLGSPFWDLASSC
jgi:hypothetical protein